MKSRVRGWSLECGIDVPEMLRSSNMLIVYAARKNALPRSTLVQRIDTLVSSDRMQMCQILMFSHVIRANGYAICTLLGEPCSIIPATLYFSHYNMQLPHETAATLGGTTAANKVVSARTSVCNGTSIPRSDDLAAFLWNAIIMNGERRHCACCRSRFDLIGMFVLTGRWC